VEREIFVQFIIPSLSGSIAHMCGGCTSSISLNARPPNPKAVILALLAFPAVARYGNEYAVVIQRRGYTTDRHPPQRRKQMSTDSIVDLLIAFVVIMVVALQVQILQLKKRLRDRPGGAPKN
jgi:hypothetical protein